MMHDVNELYKINGAKFYTEDYLDKYNVPKAPKYHTSEGWTVARYFSPNTDRANINTASGKVVVYVYGEKTWFDTKEERDEYRAKRNAERAALTKRNKILKAVTDKVNEKLKSMSDEELTALLEKLGA